MSNVENKEPDTKTTEKKKMSLQEAMKQMLEAKKQGKANGTFQGNSLNTNTSKQSQLSKKTSNQRRKMGSS
ncbi:hypothetical protein CACET_c30000 [Clostridium aceticum]|uniref:Uncharacterized protein n=1 Tax=Clostridium aceticum TaxID=84022 RepID=A0A0D8IAS5_9CLOT|nr:hypothetical protein [Clostridium aceticum]AKL96444.1 hypothetical protein CACET_c30000 [Clostridium aceticum]KJF27380.1 hypothetical protein TZ02_08575 [Clostridium aceticum]